MSLHFHSFSIVLLMSGVVTLLMSFLLFQRFYGAVRWFSWLMLFISIWAIAYAFELSSHTLNQMLFWIKIEYIGISFLPATWIFFIIKFIGRDEWITKRSTAIIFAFPVMTLFLSWTNLWHHLHYEDVSVDTSGPFPLLNIVQGPWYHVHTVYFYLMMAWGTYLVIRKFRESDVTYRRQTRVLVIGAFIPWLVNFIYLLGWRPFGHLDLTPFAFIVTSLSIAYGLLRHKLFDIIPLAREKIIEGMQEGVLVLDAEDRIIDVNPAMRKFLPRYYSEIVGEHIGDILPDEKLLLDLIKSNLHGKVELKLKNNDQHHLFEVAVAPILDKRSSGTLLLFWDITDRKQSEEKLQDQKKELLELNQFKDRIFSILAHDLRSPLASLVSILGMVNQGDISADEFKALLPVLSKDVDHTSTLLENLLYWSSSQMKGEQVQPTEFDLKFITADKLLLFERRAIEKGIHLVDYVSEGTFLFADKNMIDLVMRNLVSNALKFSSKGDRIEIQARENSDQTVICISDTGLGMDGATANNIFSNETVSTRGTQNEKGTGLGLKLCKQFIEKNNGKIWVESEAGKGSKFFFSLPKAMVKT